MQPKLRFKGFTDDWEKRKLKDFLIESRDKGTDGLKAKKLTVKLWGKGVVKKESVYLGSSATKYFTRHAGQLMYGKLDFLHGAFGIVPQELEGYESTLDSPAFNVLEINQYFLLQKLLQKNFYLYEGLIANGSRKAKRIHVDTFLDMSVKLPKREEQDKVACIFQNLDQLITVNQRKVDLLKKKKAGYLQKLFPKNGQNNPELRFKGYTDAWEKRKLGDLSEIVRGASPRPIQDPKWFDKNSNVGWLRIADVSAQNGRIYHLEQHISKIGQEKTRVLIKPHLLLSIAATVGKPVVNYVPTGVHDGFLIFLNAKFDREFMFQWLEYFRPYWRKYGQPGSQVNLNADLVRNQQIFIPNLNEQKEIGVFFNKLNNLITVNQRKVDLLKKEKKALLQKMFI